jgi:hypothetical protein
LRRSASPGRSNACARPKLKTFTPDVLRAAREISEALGYTAQ